MNIEIRGEAAGVLYASEAEYLAAQTEKEKESE